MKRFLALSMILLTTLAIAEDAKKEAPPSKPMTVREMILACPTSERGPDDGKNWKEIHYQRLADWFAKATIGQKLTMSVKVTSVRANKDGKMMLLSTSAEPTGSVFGIVMKPHSVTILVNRADEAPFLAMKDGATVTICGDAISAGLYYERGGYAKAHVAMKLENAKIIEPAKKP